MVNIALNLQSSVRTVSMYRIKEALRMPMVGRNGCSSVSSDSSNLLYPYRKWDASAWKDLHTRRNWPDHPLSWLPFAILGPLQHHSW
jgi:hypothetical protein